jgi:hypothetical protein
MGDLHFLYRFRFADGRQKVVEVRLDQTTLEPPSVAVENLPDWTHLNFHQCPNCPLAVECHPYCPLAKQLSKSMLVWKDVLSHDEVDVEIITQQRTVTQHTTAQRTISSLMGLIIATSGCPHTDFLKPLARFHLPLASEEETIFRVSAMYLLAQYFRRKHGETADLELTGLKRIYDTLHEVNMAMASRLRAASSTDAAVNAVVLLDLFAKSLPYAIEDSLEEIRYLFKPYFD